MTTNFEIIQSHLKYGSLSDNFHKQNTRFLNGMNMEAVMIQGYKGIIAFLSLAKTIHKSKDIKDHYTLRHVEKVLDDVLLKNIKNERATEQSIIDACKSLLPTSNIEKFDIVRNVFGITLSKNYRKIDSFIFQKGTNAYRSLLHNHPWRSQNIKNHLSEYVVRYQVTSVTQARALEIADDTFTKLEYLFAFIFGKKDSGYEVRILRPTNENISIFLQKSSSGQITIGHHRQNEVHKQIDLNDNFFKNKKVRKLFSIVSSQTLSPIERRLQRAITWVGKGLYSASSIDSIICYCSALESLLIRDSKTIISPSIIASLSEYCAFFLGNDYRSRKKIVKKVRKIYSERSSGTHGGKISADTMIEETALSLSRAMISKILELSNNKITSENDVVTYIDQQKYS